MMMASIKRANTIMEGGQLDNIGNSLILKLVLAIAMFTRSTRLLPLIHRTYNKINRDTPYWLNDAYVLLFALIVPVLLFTVDCKQSLFFVVVLVACYRLYDFFGYGIDCFCDLQNRHFTDGDGYYMYVRSPLRWIASTMINAIEMIICFAVLYLYYGSSFTIDNAGPITTPISALYYSFVNTTTLGTGDIAPNDDAGRSLVTLHLMFFIYFFFIIIPIVFESIRVKQINLTPNNLKKESKMNYSEVIMVVYFDEGVTGEKERAIEAFNNAQKLATGIEMKKNDISGGVKYLASWKAEDDYGTGRQYAIKIRQDDNGFWS